MATSPEWALGFDKDNRLCWYNKETKATLYPQSPLEATMGLSTVNGTGSNIPTAAPFTPATGLVYEALVKQAVAGAWKEYQTDDGDKRTYWYNEITNDTKWEKPTTLSPRKPPPPPSQPSAPPAPKEPSPHTGKGGGKQTKIKKDEKDQWKEQYTKEGRKYWYNEETGDSQYETPRCLWKYR